jgi:type IV pilus assembly protein PilB
VRRVCQKCKKLSQTSPELIELVKKAMGRLKAEGEIDPALLAGLQFYEAVGCAECNNVGYVGRVGLYEVFRMNNELRRLIGSSANMLDVEDAALRNGMVTLEQAGIVKALQGMTTLDEVYRVARKSD